MAMLGAIRFFASSAQSAAALFRPAPCRPGIAAAGSGRAAPAKRARLNRPRRGDADIAVLVRCGARHISAPIPDIHFVTRYKTGYGHFATTSRIWTDTASQMARRQRPIAGATPAEWFLQEQMRQGRQKHELFRHDDAYNAPLRSAASRCRMRGISAYSGRE